jgi:hypothetical protein
MNHRRTGLRSDLAQSTDGLGVNLMRKLRLALRFFHIGIGSAIQNNPPFGNRALKMICPCDIERPANPAP